MPKAMSYKSFEKAYPLVKNGDGEMFETYGKDLAFVQQQEPSKVWTLIEEGGKRVIISGFHVVNRIGYYVSTVSAKSQNITVKV